MASSKSKKRPGSVRIVAGQWRRRPIRVADAVDLRPTPDRVREMLFNWLSSEIYGLRVLDLYAGSGVLGLEALSRGADYATLVEKNPRLSQAISENLEVFEAGTRAQVITDEVERFLAGPPVPVDGVFMDPPYRAVEHTKLCTLLKKNGWLKPAAWLYLEQQGDAPLPDLAPGFSLQKNKTTGQVRSMLVRFRGDDKE